ncbi:DNA sulfur modification protein DndB [Streptomyces cavernicola]|uniref:DNA sulfur modification protein DndB n=1 Tax=Streptomyces cavernicola TaxID=3043613 RepID=A0ABT6S548_9ACTN|nr:DNA sulfur modification protein DndB [Streptomyces sp. B-S-A6]MDI3402431.1 DNA sulfur modification protein DndB [Streptomyces sp. B-S-A6]
MRLTMPTTVIEGTRITVMPFRDNAVLGTVSLPALLQLVPSPRREEDQKSLKAASGHVRQHAEIRAQVQRTLKSTGKGKNATSYAEYIAGGINGEFGDAWSLPPITFWHADDVAAVSDELVPGTGLRNITIAPGATVVAVDGETQLTAWHDLFDDPEKFGLGYEQLAAVRIPFEMYVGLSSADARQVFHDRNVLGVDVSKNLSMSMDQRDLATRLAHRVAEAVKVEVDGKLIPFSKLVNASKRQVGKTDPEVVTLSALRALVVASVYGRSGLNLSSATIHEEDLPAGTGSEVVERTIVPLLAGLITEHLECFTSRSAITAPAVIAGLGVAVHQTTPWADSLNGLHADDLRALLADIRWEREASYWDGIAAKTGTTGRLNFSGGVKDSGGRVADAILYPATESGQKIRGHRA